MGEFQKRRSQEGEVKMGMFLNPDNAAFRRTVNSKIYVDKTELLEFTNSVIDTEQNCICNSRPRRFGKSITANMLTAYYSKGCNSEELFDGLKISKTEDFREHLNKYDVIHFDVQWCFMDCGSAEGLVSYIESNVIQELKTEFPDFDFSDITSLGGALARVAQSTSKKFIIIIDEWDVLIRDEAANTAVQNEYIDFLRGLFKGTEPSKFLHLAFLTGILPIKKVRTQSALNNFDEFSMVSPKKMAPYIGFTEDEVKELCEKYGQNFDEVKCWYDGYILGNYQVYNPGAVVSVMLWGEFQSYWSQTGTNESILPLINMDFDGLKAAVIEMLSGRSVKVKTTTYQNDMITFKNKNDVLTALIHLGYLAYRQDNKTAFIPNEEIRSEFESVYSDNG